MTAATLEGIVTADAQTLALIARFNEAKRVRDDAEKRVKQLSETLKDKMDAANALKFADELDEIVLSRTEVLAAERVDLPKLKRIAPAIYAQVVLPRTKFWRLNTPTIRR